MKFNTKLIVGGIIIALLFGYMIGYFCGLCKAAHTAQLQAVNDDGYIISYNMIGNHAYAFSN